MHAHDAVLHQGSQGEPVEQGVHARPRPHARLSQPLQALQTEAEQGVDVASLSGTRLVSSRMGVASSCCFSLHPASW